jgi:uncharacterized protein (DUF1501 family)
MIPESYTTPTVVNDLTAAAAVNNDYKAMVCVFLFGAEDSHNSVIPLTGTNRTRYDSIRSNIGISATASPLHTLSTDWRLHPNYVNIHSKFVSGDIGIVFNVGPLHEPITKTQYTNKTKMIPEQLFSHNTQQSFWMTSPTLEGITLNGWMGRANDLASTYYNTTPYQEIQSTFTLGDITQVIGWNSYPSVLTTAGAKTVRTPTQFSSNILTDLNSDRAQERQPRNNDIQKALALKTKTGKKAQVDLNTALLALPTNVNALFDSLPTNFFAQQLRVVARTIYSRTNLGHRRQMFFTGFGTWDHHDTLLTNHASQITLLDQGLGVFWQALGLLGLNDSVVTFTESDFGRTLLQNGSNGSDHGWGGHRFIMGGPVTGGLYGTPPDLSSTGPDDIGQGRLIPTTSSDQMIATVLKWWGIPEQHLNLVLPNLDNFSAKVIPNIL